MKRKYTKDFFDRIYFISICGFVISVSILAFSSDLLQFILFPITMLPFTVLMGYAIYVNSKLPKKDRAKVSYGLSIFSIHPAVTFAFFVVLSIFGFIECYIL